ncbi:MAG: TRAP transporter small permease [Deltaproteobacteria bacterium]|nr:TRAP transporter small permease [Deltaproteobacteria bacterium]
MDRLNNFLNAIFMILGGIAVLALMALATGNVVLRILDVPLKGTYEIVSFLGAVVIAFALGYSHKARDHMIVDIVSDRYPQWLKKLVDSVADCVITLFFGVVSWQVFVWGLKIRNAGELSETLKIPFHPFVFAVGLGFGALALTSLIELINKFSGQEE